MILSFTKPMIGRDRKTAAMPATAMQIGYTGDWIGQTGDDSFHQLEAWVKGLMVLLACTPAVIDAPCRFAPASDAPTNSDVLSYFVTRNTTYSWEVSNEIRSIHNSDSIQR